MSRSLWLRTALTGALMTFGLASATVACSTKKTARKEASTKPTSIEKTTTGGSTTGGNDDCKAAGLSDGTARKKKSAASTLGLLAGENYEDDVKPLIVAECLSCHPGQSTSFATYAEAKPYAAKMVERMEGRGNLMPTSGALPQAKIDIVKGWIAGGLKESAAAAGDDDDGDGSQSTGGSTTEADEEEDDAEGPCATTTTEAGEEDDLGAGDLLDQLLTPPELEKCHAEKHAFFRSKSEANPFGKCETDVSYPAAFNCDRAGVVAAFNNNPDLTPTLDDYEGQGYFYDQCGTHDGEPVVYLACFTKGGEKDCEEKKCVPREEVTGDSAKICAKRIR